MLACYKYYGGMAIMALLLWSSAVAELSPEQISKDLATRNNAIIEQLLALRQQNNLTDETALSLIQKELSPIINFAKLSQQSLGKHWRRATDEEKQQVTTIFRQLLERTYSKVLRRYSDQKIKITDTKPLPKNKLAVNMIIAGSGKSVDIEYVYHEKDGIGKIVDIKIEGVSLLSAYRRQFTQIIKKEGIEGLIGRLRELANR